MRNTSSQAGFSLVELIVASAILLLVLVAAFGIFSQAASLNKRVQGNMEIQANVRLALNNLEKDLRMIGFGVPRRSKIGGTSYWSPAIFHASSTEIGYRADTDGGNTAIICTPKSSNITCPLNKLLLSSSRYYEALDCHPADGSSGDLQIVAVAGGGEWEPTTCSSVNTSENSISVALVTDNKFTGGISQTVTIEQVYYRYVPGVAPRYGRLEKYVRYGNEPDGTFPPPSAEWDVVADYLTNFSMDYENGSGAPLSGDPLTSAEIRSVRRIVITIEGSADTPPVGHSLLFRARSELAVRNP